MKKIQKLIVLFSIFCIALLSLSANAEVIEVNKPANIEVTNITIEAKNNIISTTDVLKISASIANINPQDVNYCRVTFSDRDVWSNNIVVKLYYNSATCCFEGVYDDKKGLIEGIYRFQLLSILGKKEEYYKLGYSFPGYLIINNNCAKDIHEVYADSWESYTYCYRDKNCSHELTKVRKCNICGQIVDTQYLGSSITDWIVLKDSGIKEKRCLQCGVVVEQQSIPKNGEIIPVSSGVYKVTSVGDTVEYCGSKSVNNAIVSETVTYDGITYKVTSIAPGAFKNNKKLTKVTIGSNVKTIGKQAFYGCKNLKSITIKSTKLTTKSVGAKAFTKAGSKNYKKLVVKVPKSKKKAYVKLLKKKGLSSKAKIK